jgi:flagellar motor switch protein FliG
MLDAKLQGRPAGLTQRRKAAMVVQLLLAEGQKLSLAGLPEHQQMLLTRELGSLRLIDRATLDAVATEFAKLLDSIALATPGGVEGALAALGTQISPATAARLREEASHSSGGDPWAQVLALPIEALKPIMEGEATEVCAILLSKLPVPKAAELLGQLPGERARRIAFAVSQTGQVTPAAVARIGAGLAADHCVASTPAFSQPPVHRVGAILNSSLAATRDSVLEGLGSDDPAFADLVRKAIFTFLDIPARLARNDVPKVIRGVDGAVLVTALGAGLAEGEASAAVSEFILANMSQRMADQLREEIGERGKIKKSDGEAAQNLLIAAIRERADAGEVTLIEADEPEE